MTAAAIPADLARLLDLFTVPPLAADFADRVVARALAQRDRPVGWRHRSGIRRWARRSLVVGSATVLAATAAAAGVFGERIAVPLISPLVELIMGPAPADSPRNSPPAALRLPSGEAALPTTHPLVSPLPVTDPDPAPLQQRAVRQAAHPATMAAANAGLPATAIAELPALSVPLPEPLVRQLNPAAIPASIAQPARDGAVLTADDRTEQTPLVQPADGIDAVRPVDPVRAPARTQSPDRAAVPVRARPPVIAPTRNPAPPPPRRQPAPARRTPGG